MAWKKWNNYLRLPVLSNWKKECVEIINNLPKQNIITKVNNYNPIENKLTGKKNTPKH